MLSGDLSIQCICLLILSLFSLLFTSLYLSSSFSPVGLILMITPVSHFTCKKKSLAYFLIVNLTRPPCIKSKSSLLISMSLTNKEYLYSRKTRLRSKVSLSEFYGPWAWLYLGMPNFLFVFCRRYARWMGRWMSDSLERMTGGWVLFIEHYVCTVIETYMYMHMVMK